jgi:hypothetical protein
MWDVIYSLIRLIEILTLLNDFQIELHYFYVAYTFLFWTSNAGVGWEWLPDNDQEQLLDDLTAPMQFHLGHLQNISYAGVSYHRLINSWCDWI